MPRIGLRLLLALVLLIAFAGISAAAFTGHPVRARRGEAPAAILRVRVLQDKDAPGLEITSSRPITPTIGQLDGPPRIVVDLPDTLMSVPNKQIPVQSARISAVRLNQYQKKPPVVRIVFDLLQPSEYSSESVGNVLTVRLHALSQARAATTPTFTKGVQAASTANGATSGAVMFAGRTLATGSSITAGSDTSVLRLGRGGEVRVCPGTTVSVTSSPNGRELMLGMSTGALEAHYTIGAFSDSVLTPDFRILLTGPGEFHYAFSADTRGNTCVQALPGNAASAIVQELMGDGSYQVKPNEEVVFRSGHLNMVDATQPPSCGCPAPPTPVMEASAAAPDPGASLPLATREQRPTEAATPVPPAGEAAIPATNLPAQVRVSVTHPETAPVPAGKPNDVHVQVEAPFVYRATDEPTAHPQPAPAEQAESLPMTFSQAPGPIETVTVAPPPPPLKPEKTKEHHGFFGKIKGFFGAIFR